MLRPCIECSKSKVETEFYVSNKSRCKECVKASVRSNRSRKAGYYRAYDRKRYREQEKRKEAARKSAKSYSQEKRYALIKLQKQREPEKFAARNAVNNALRTGKLERGTECFFCKNSERLQAHHHDYNMPLDIIWLCAKCHGKLHYVTGDLRRTG